MFMTVSVRLPTMADFFVPPSLSSLKMCTVPVSDDTHTMVDIRLNDIE